MQTAFDALEWPKLFDALLSQCQTSYGVEAWQSAPFFEDAESARLHQAEVNALQVLIFRFGEVILSNEFPSQEFPPVAAPLKRLEKGGTLSLEELARLYQCLSLGEQLTSHIQTCHERHPQIVLESLLSDIPVVTGVLAQLDQVLQKNGRLKDTASPQYATLSQRLHQQRQGLYQRLEQFLQSPTLSPMLQSQTITEREGRLVLPVKVEFQSRIPGYIHGMSSTGSTVFIEPDNVANMNRSAMETEQLLMAEAEKIIESLSRSLQPELEVLWQFLAILGRLDRRLAGARISRQLNAIPCEIVDGPVMHLRQARHPLLVLQYRGSVTPIIPNDFTLGDGIRTMIITGPNTGGKTVQLKTVGLCALMIRAGLPLPVAENSTMGFLDPILADIGDQQSLAQSLSTFAAHVKQLQYYVADTTNLENGLVLIDELAAGTDPAEGAALARAILDELYQKQALTVITTHLGELKIEAHQHPGYINASVEFDVESLRPTYRLQIGTPGSSNALTIARQLGISDRIIDKARQTMSVPVREVAKLIEDLEQRNHQLRESLSETERLRQEAQTAHDQVMAEKKNLELEKRRILKDFQNRLKSQVHDLEDEMKSIQSRQDLKALAQLSDELFQDTAKGIESIHGLQAAELSVGRVVYSKSLNLSAAIFQILPGDKVILQSGVMKVTVPLGDLQDKPPAAQPKKRRSVLQAPIGTPLQPGAKPVSTKASKFVSSNECDVRGQRVDDAIVHVEQFLDEAMMLGCHEVGVIHGLGTGSLKKAIRAFLSEMPYVKSFHPADPQDGGDGKTIVEL